MVVFVFETNAPSGVPIWTADCVSAEDARVQAVRMLGDIVRAVPPALLTGSSISVRVSYPSGERVLGLEVHSSV